MNRTRVKQLLRHGQVSVNGTSITRHDHVIRPGDAITISHEGSNRAARQPDLPIVFEDRAIIAIDKPAGLLTVATEDEKTDTAFARLRAELESRNAGRPFVLHRLDRDTSGLLLFARTPAIRDSLQANWDAIQKTYLAVVEGVPRQSEGVIDNYLFEGKNLRVRVVRADVVGAKRALSRYRLVSRHGRYSLVEVAIETGRKHQIRVHLSGIGCPVIGDKDYGATTNPARRLGLHAWKLSFQHPESGERLELESPLPAALQRVIE
jgi:23S rRNA pseudouridine1911/1915/1917 synthase